MEIDAILNLLHHDNQLKRTARTGWVQRGVADAENVAAHSHGVAFAALLLAELLAPRIPLDRGRLLALAVLHDLPESLTTDIPAPAWAYLPAGIKRDVEHGALQTMLADAPFAPAWLALFEELHDGRTAEARLVHDADKIDMYLQAVVYEEQTGNRQLAEFWRQPHTFHFPEAQALYDWLRQTRPATAGTD